MTSGSAEAIPSVRRAGMSVRSVSQAIGTAIRTLAAVTVTARPMERRASASVAGSSAIAMMRSAGSCAATMTRYATGTSIDAATSTAGSRTASGTPRVPRPARTVSREGPAAPMCAAGPSSVEVATVSPSGSSLSCRRPRPPAGAPVCPADPRDGRGRRRGLRASRASGGASSRHRCAAGTPRHRRGIRMRSGPTRRA